MVKWQGKGRGGGMSVASMLLLNQEERAYSDGWGARAAL
jgi:hypothetical protein